MSKSPYELKSENSLKSFFKKKIPTKKLSPYELSYETSLAKYFKDKKEIK